MTAENVEDHIAYTCKCGGVNFALLKSGQIECNACGKDLDDARWGDGPLSFQIRRAIAAEDALCAMQAEIAELRAELAKHQENAAANKVDHDAFNQLLAERAEILRLTTQAKRHQDKLTAERDALETHNAMLKAALRGVIKVADRKTDEFDAAHAAIGEAK